MIFLKPECVPFVIFEFLTARYRTPFLVIFGICPVFLGTKKNDIFGVFYELKNGFETINFRYFASCGIRKNKINFEILRF